MTERQHDVQLFLSSENSCSYLPDRESRSLIVDPQLPLDSAIYGQLLALGFRRSGDYVYSPHCVECDACIPVRIPVEQFTPNRSQRRTWQKNRDVTVVRGITRFTSEHYSLYKRYLSSRHGGGEMEKSSKTDSEAFLLASWCDTELLEFRLDQQLVAVAVTDLVPEGLSSVYTFFHPGMPERSLGVYAILQQISTARNCGHSWLYLGYYISECTKMAYKTNYRPIELRLDNTWRLLGKKDPVPSSTCI